MFLHHVYSSPILMVSSFLKNALGSLCSIFTSKKVSEGLTHAANKKEDGNVVREPLTSRKYTSKKDSEELTQAANKKEDGNVVREPLTSRKYTSKYGELLIENLNKFLEQKLEEFLTDAVTQSVFRKPLFFKGFGCTFSSETLSELLKRNDFHSYKDGCLKFKNPTTNDWIPKNSLKSDTVVERFHTLITTKSFYEEYRLNDEVESLFFHNGSIRTEGNGGFTFNDTTHLTWKSICEEFNTFHQDDLRKREEEQLNILKEILKSCQSGG